MTLLRVRFSGQYEILLNNQMVNLGYNKVRALFAYLLVENEQPHSREELAGLLWPDTTEISGRKNLRQALMTMRLALHDNDASHPFFGVNRETIQFNLRADIFSDILAISTLMIQSAEHSHNSIETCQPCYERLHQAADLYKGDFLSGFSIPNSLPFEEWLMFTRERFRLQAIDILGILVSASEFKRDHENAIQFSRRRLILDPWNEDAYRALMRSLSRMGQRTAAMVEYERCKRILWDDLAISPSRETNDLAAQIRSETANPVHDEKLPLQTAHPFIPLPLSAMIDRESETKTLTDFLSSEGIRLVTLLGPPGIGKTRLALHLASVLKEEFNGNVHFLSMISISDPEIAIDTIARALGLVAETNLSPLDFLKRTINGQKILLVLDNLEHIPSTAKTFLKILQSCAHLKILATSQAPLKIHGEQRFYLKPLQLPDEHQAQNTEIILSSPAVRLFIDAVQRDIPGFEFNSQNTQVAAEICELLDGLPLALELAAASVKILSLRQLHAKISQATISSLKDMKNKDGDTDVRHQTLWQAFQWSFNLLDPGAQTLFSRLGIFNGGWSLEAADAVCNFGDISSGSVDSMVTLLENSLMQRIESQTGEYRFSMLAPIREFALERINVTGDTAYLHQRHADYFLTYAKLAEPELSAHNQLEWLEKIELDLDNFRAAMIWTMENSPNEALQLSVALFPFWHIRSYLQEGQNNLERACAKNPHPSPLRSRGLATAGLLAQRQGNYSRAKLLLDESIVICRQLNDRFGLAYALNNLSIVMMSTGDQNNALDLANESLALCKDLDFQLGIARALMVHGQIAYNQDDLPAAWKSLETSLAFWRKNGDYKNLIFCLINLGRIRISQGNYLEAEKILNESLTLSRKLKDQHWEIVAMWNLGDIQLRHGNHTQALPVMKEVNQRSTKIGDRFFEALAYDRLGVIAIMNRDYEQGINYFNQSHEIGRAIGSNWLIASALSNLGFTSYLQGEPFIARSLLTQSAQMFFSLNEQADLIQTLERLGLISLRLDQVEQAVIMLSAADFWRHSKGEPVPPVNNQIIQQSLDELKRRLGNEAYASYWVVGQTKSLSQVVSEVDNE